MSIPSTPQETTALFNAPFFEQPSPARASTLSALANSRRPQPFIALANYSPCLKRTSTMIPSPLITALKAMLPPVPSSSENVEKMAIPEDVASEISFPSSSSSTPSASTAHMPPSCIAAKPNMPVSLINCSSSSLPQLDLPACFASRFPAASMPAPGLGPGPGSGSIAFSQSNPSLLVPMAGLATSPDPTMVSKESPLVSLSRGSTVTHASSVVSLPVKISSMSTVPESQVSPSSAEIVAPKIAPVDGDIHSAKNSAFSDQHSTHLSMSEPEIKSESKSESKSEPESIQAHAPPLSNDYPVHSDSQAAENPSINMGNHISDSESLSNSLIPNSKAVIDIEEDCEDGPGHSPVDKTLSPTPLAKPSMVKRSATIDNLAQALDSRTMPRHSTDGLAGVLESRTMLRHSTDGLAGIPDPKEKHRDTRDTHAHALNPKEKRFSFRQLLRLISKPHSLTRDEEKQPPMHKSHSQSDILLSPRPPPKLSSSLFLGGFRRNKQSANSNTASQTQSRPEPDQSKPLNTHPSTKNDSHDEADSNDHAFISSDQATHRTSLSHYIRAVSDSPDTTIHLALQLEDSKISSNDGVADPHHSVEHHSTSKPNGRGLSIITAGKSTKHQNDGHQSTSSPVLSGENNGQPTLTVQDFDALTLNDNLVTSWLPESPAILFDHDGPDVSPGDSLFPKSLNAQEVESIVSLERLRLMRSINGATKRSSFVNYNGSDENIVHFSGHNHHPLPSIDKIARTPSILKSSTSERRLSLKLAVPKQTSFPDSHSRSPLSPSMLDPGHQDICPPIRPILLLHYTPELDQFDFSEFSDLLALDDLSFIGTPQISRDQNQFAGTVPSTLNEKPESVLLLSSGSRTSPRPKAYDFTFNDSGLSKAARTPDLISLSSPQVFPPNTNTNAWGKIANDPDSPQILDIFGSSPYDYDSDHTANIDSSLPSTLPPAQDPATFRQSPLINISPAFTGPNMTIGQGFGTPDNDTQDDEYRTQDDGDDTQDEVNGNFSNDNEGTDLGNDRDGGQTYLSATQSQIDSKRNSLYLNRVPAKTRPQMRLEYTSDLASASVSVSLSHHLFGLLISRRWRRLPSSRNSPSAPQSPPAALTVRFSSRIILYDTFHEDDYDRHPDIATCNQLTPQLAHAIKEELNTLKRLMQIHPDLQCYTHYF